MTTTAISNAVSDAAAGLPSGWTQYVADNIGSAAGQQAIVAAAANYGITNPATIARLVNQATGMNVTAAQVQSVAAPTPTPTPAPAPTPAPTPAPAPAASSGTSLANIAAAPAQYQAFTSSNPGGIGTSYGQASPDLISQAQQSNPALATALQNGTAQYNVDDTGNGYLVDTSTGQQIGGTYNVTSTPSGQTAISIPTSSGAMIQAIVGSSPSGNGMLSPVTSNNVFNVGLNSSEGGFAGGISNFTKPVETAALLYAGGQLAGAGLDAAGLGTTAAAPMVVGSAGGEPLLGTAVGTTPASGALAAGGIGTDFAAPAVVGTGAGTTLADVGAGTTAAGGTAAAGGAAAGAAGGAAAGGAAAGGAAAGAAAAGAAAGLTAAQIAALAAAGVSLVNNSTLTNANNSAAATQAAAGQNAQNLIQGLYTQQGQLQSPYQQAGVNALNTLGSLGSGTYNKMNATGGTTGTGTGSGYLTNQFNNTDLNAQLAPNYAFQLQQGQGQAQNAANVGGGLLSGNTLQGLNQYTQNYAQGAYQNAFTNYQTQRNNIYNTLAGQAGLGQNANAQLSSLGGGLAQTYGNVTTGLAASAASQQVANAQNQTNLLSNLTNAAVTAFAPTPTPTQIVIKAPA